MLNVLKPFEIADGDTSGVAKYVWQEFNTLFDQDLLSGLGGWAISSLDYQFTIEFMCIINIDWFFKGGWDKNIAALTNIYHYL